MRHIATVIMAAVILGLVALGTVLDRSAPTPPATPRGVAHDAVAGAWVCAVGDTAEGSTLEVLAVAPASEGGAASALDITTFHDGDVTSRTSAQVFPNSALAHPLDPGIEDVGTMVRWWDVPAAVSREWRVEAEGTPSGIVAGPCQPGASDRWVVPGVATAGGAQARVVLANPFTAAASVAVTLATPDGLVAPKRLENVVVPPRSVVEVPLNEHAPEQPDLGVVVTTRSGRVVTEAIQTFDAAIGGIEGRSLALAAPAPAESWTIPSVRTGEDATSWIWVTNPSEREAVIAVSLHTGSGGIVPDGMQELTVAPGTTRRIELVGLLEGEETAAAAVVTVDNGVPVTVSAATQYRDAEEERTGITVSLGTPDLDSSWTLAPGRIEDRSVLVDLVNPGGAAVAVDLAIWTGAGLVRPDELSGLTVPAGGSRVVEVSPFLEEASGPVAVFVTAPDGRIAAGARVSAPEGRRDAVAFAGVPAARFRTPPGAPLVAFDPHLPERIGTSLGPAAPGDPLLEELEDTDELDDPGPLPPVGTTVPPASSPSPRSPAPRSPGASPRPSPTPSPSPS